MNNNLMLLGLLAAGFLFLRRPTSNGAGSVDPGFYAADTGYRVPGQMENPVTPRVTPREVSQRVMGFDEGGWDQWGVL